MPLNDFIFSENFQIVSRIALSILVVIAGLYLARSPGIKRMFKKIRFDGSRPSCPQHRSDQPFWHAMSVEQVHSSLTSDPVNGLSEHEVADRLSCHGPNRLAEKPPKSPWLLLFSQFKSLLILLLLAAAVFAAAIGDVIDGIVILTVVFINALLGFYQEYQAEKSLIVLTKMLALRAEVRREGNNAEIAAETLVPGDLVILKAGDKIPADGRILTAHGLEIDESSLTGESMPVNKQAEALANIDLPLAERSNLLFMNTAVTRGRAEMMVVATGMGTEMGKLAGLLAHPAPSSTPLQKQLDSLGKRMAIIALAIIVVLFVGSLMRGEDLIQTAFSSIALAVAAIPEGLPTVVTVTLALGMHRMARQHAIVKRLAAVETLGCTTVICTDKTGTLTLNQMTARSIYYQGHGYRVSGNGYQLNGEIFPFDTNTLPADLGRLLLPLVLCNNSRICNGQILGDPMEAALIVLASKGGIDREHANEQWQHLAEIPFDAEHKFMAVFYRNDEGVKAFIKGAPEVLINRCTHIICEDQVQPLTHRETLLLQNEKMACTGLRVLAVAEKILPLEEFSRQGNLFDYLDQLTFIGLIGMMDPPRQEALQAIRLCRKAGIQIKMITGDQKVTATAIAGELELSGLVLEGSELTGKDDNELAEIIDDVAVFARTAPEQKVRIVEALKTKGHVVAMTGDGVNDAPALKSADIGVAMGVCGTHVAQEAATMILTDDNFATIVNAVREGRGIYENMIKFVRFQLSTNIGAILTVACAPLLSLPVPFTAVQLLWINIIMDGPPAMSLGIDPCRRESMSEPPRSMAARILSWRRFGNLLTYGLTMAIGTLAVLIFDFQKGDPMHARTLAFNTFVLFQIFNVFNARAENQSTFNRQFFANRMLWFSVVGVIVLQILVIHWPWAQHLFKTTSLNETDWMIAVTVASSILLLEELRKLLKTIINRCHLMKR